MTAATAYRDGLERGRRDTTARDVFGDVKRFRAPGLVLAVARHEARATLRHTRNRLAYAYWLGYLRALREAT